MTSLASGVTGGMVVGLLLASGFGRRFDTAGRRNKLLAKLPDGRALAATSARALCEVLDHVAVVVPARAHLLEASLSDLPVRLIHNPRAREGIGASIAVGIGALRRDFPNASGWLIALGDMPFVMPRTIRAIVGALQSSEGDGDGDHAWRAVAPVYRGRRGHPVAFARGCDDALVALTGDTGASRLLHAGRLTTIECDDPGILRDIDTRDDLARTGDDHGG